jgi:hypothetical protein
LCGKHHESMHPPIERAIAQQYHNTSSTSVSKNVGTTDSAHLSIKLFRHVASFSNIQTANIYINLGSK